MRALRFKSVRMREDLSLIINLFLFRVLHFAPKTLTRLAVRIDERDTIAFLRERHFLLAAAARMHDCVPTHEHMGDFCCASQQFGCKQTK